ncbi:hypothetical protein RHSIM_Rhsim02G0255000 [Rhododendron simsii]|uniref:Uncharacterized protein n=1 Tax=Rhododendron simsii TaxID=118357 RepID=A0A834LWR5_RHOSS|nr:hypothetical protein RHSIM_Rhsim02G0255000 [Rhododendron simsii]
MTEEMLNNVFGALPQLSPWVHVVPPIPLVPVYQNQAFVQGVLFFPHEVMRLQSLPGGKGRTFDRSWIRMSRQVAINVPPLTSQPSVLILHPLEQTFRMEVVCTSYLVWRVDPTFTGSTIAEECERGCFSPLWVAFSILFDGLLLDVLISITLGVSALPITSIIGIQSSPEIVQ